MSRGDRGKTRRGTSGSMPTYCIFAYHFPPATSAGAVRAHGLARELAAAGNEVHVFAPEPGPGGEQGYEVHLVPGAQAGDKLKSRLGVAPGGSFRSGSRVFRYVPAWVPRVVQEWTLFPDGARAWAERCATAASAWLDDHPCDVLISTSPPVSAHLAAHRALGHHRKTVWIVDWRDLWLQAPQYKYGSFRRLRDLRLEQSFMRRCDAATVTTATSGRILAEAYPDALIRPVYNGFDSAASPDVAPRADDRDRFTITHAGFLYEGNRSAAPLLSSIRRLTERGDIDRSRLRVRFAGPPDASLEQTIAGLDLADVVELVGVIPRTEVPALLASSDVLAVIMWDPVREAPLVPAKTFEYMAARRPILALNSAASSELGSLVARTRTGVSAVSPDEIDAALLGLYRRFLDGGPLVADPDEEELARYTHVHMAGEFADLARTLLAGG